MNYTQDPRHIRDIKYIKIRFLQKVDKKDIKITLAECITRQEARDIMDLIEDGPASKQILSVEGWTQHNSYI
jgi:hypothetical protein